MPFTQIMLSALMLAAGIGIPIMAAWNAGLGARLANPMAAVVILCLVALALSVILLFSLGMPRPQLETRTIPLIYFGAGVLFVLYIASITYAAPRIGLANAVFFVLLGQLLSAALIDHFGLWEAVRSPITDKRIIGLILMGIGLFLARKDVTSYLPPSP